MTRLFYFLCLLITSTACFANKAPVIIISIDGFSHQYLTQYKPKNILALAREGVSSKGLLPVFPSKTFPNHLSIITGSYPAKHGIVHNNFYSPILKKNYHLGAANENSAWLTALPLWAVAEQQGVKSAVYFWPESEVKIPHGQPSFNMHYNKSTPNNNRIDKIITWLQLPKNQRPQFIAGYFSIVDTAGHEYGNNSVEVQHAVHDIDDVIGYLITRLKNEITEPVNLILVSDHGMTPAGDENAIPMNRVIPEQLSTQKGVLVVNGHTQLNIYFDKNIKNDDRTSIFNQLSNDATAQYQVFQKGHYPNHWHFNQSQAVIPDLIVNAQPPFTFVSKGKHASAGTHGYDPKGNNDLAAIFIASGPNFKQGLIIEPFENVHVFPLITQLLGIKNPENIDGNVDVLSNILK